MPAPTSQALSLQIRPSNGLVPGRLTAEAQSSERLPRRAPASLMHVGHPGLQAELGDKAVLREVDRINHSHAFADFGHVNACFCVARPADGRTRFSATLFLARARVVSAAGPVEFPDSRCKSFREREKETFGSERARQPPNMIFTELGLALRVGASFDASSLETIIGGQTVRIDKAGTAVEVWCFAVRCTVCLMMVECVCKRSGIVIAGGWMHRLIIRADGKESRHT